MKTPLSDEELKDFSGSELITIGILIVMLCGLCSGCVVLKSFDPHDEAGIFLGFVPFVGGVPILCGLVLIYRGWRKGRRHD